MRPAPVLGLLLALAGCAGEGGLTVVDAWARPTPPESDVAAFYVTVRSAGNDDELIGAASDVCGSTALHDTLREDGVMEMRHIGSVEVGAGEELEMVPGGTHIMCLDLREPLVEGREVTLLLHFAESPSLEARVSVEQR